MLSRSIFWLWFAGLVFLALGLFTFRKKLSAAAGLDKLIELGPVFVAASIAVFGAEHFSSANALMAIVPAWMPARLFWVYFVGLALLAAALSIVLIKYVRLSATLLGVMFLLFVLMLHLPRAVANPTDRIAWTIVFRETAFAGGAWALAGGQLAVAARFMIAIALIFFGVENALHPGFAPGVPLAKLTPSWVPLGVFWGYLTGTVLLIGGICLLAGWRSRIALAWVGLLVTLLTLFLYLPIFLMDGPPALLEGMNYVADTLLFAGTVLCMARALPRGHLTASVAPSGL